MSRQQHPPKKDFVRAVSLLTGYFVQSGGAAGSSLYYLSQLDPRGERNRIPLSSRPGVGPHLALQTSLLLSFQVLYQSGW